MSIIRFETIENKLAKYNNQWVLLDKDVAALYEIEPKKLRQQVKRNSDKFPSDYVSQLSETDLDMMVSQNVTPSKYNALRRETYIVSEVVENILANIITKHKRDNESRDKRSYRK